MSCSKVTILSLLDAYTQAHEQAQSEQKSCVWQLFKARQSKGRRGALVDGVLQGQDIREDLYARKILKEENDEEPALVSGNPKPMSSSLEQEQLQRHFLLVDALAETKKKQEMDKENSSSRNDDIDDNNVTGIRRRRGKTSSETTTSTAEWTIVDEEEEEEENAEERLRKANPIDFFGGFPPRELRKAQEEAEKMLASYVDAANIIVSIQNGLARK